MAIQRVESIAYGVEDIPRCIQYFDDFDLERVEQGASGATFRTLTNQIVEVRTATDTALPPTHEQGSTLRFIVWGVDNEAGLEAQGGMFFARLGWPL